MLGNVLYGTLVLIAYCCIRESPPTRGVRISVLRQSRFIDIEEMKPKPDLTSEPAWAKLQQYFDVDGSKIKIYDLFQQDPKRFEKFRQVFANP